jgi:hypothetical protein
MLQNIFGVKKMFACPLVSTQPPGNTTQAHLKSGISAPGSAQTAVF